MSEFNAESTQKPQWQQLEEDNDRTINEIVINLIKGGKGEAYRKIMLKLFRNSAAHRARVAPEYRERLQEILSKENF